MNNLFNGKVQAMQPAPTILHIAVPSPLRRQFDYLPPAGTDPSTLKPGIRVRVPFGRTTRIGILLDTGGHTDVPADKLKPATELLDDEPVLEPAIMVLAEWAARYYHHPVGDVMASALPVLLRQGQPPVPRGSSCWLPTDAGRQTDIRDLKRAPRQASILERLRSCEEAVPTAVLLDGGSDAPLRSLEQKGLARRITVASGGTMIARKTREALTLNTPQQQAVDAVSDSLDDFQAWLLYGVTGSGKTEVYLQLIERVLAAGRQTLLLVPEIGLTPQLLRRFEKRFDTTISLLHSGMSDSDRLNAWLAARSGMAGIVIGTRSAIFTPLARPGLIIIDEEHDGSFKQQEGFRYSARDLALVRARNEDVPIVLGSATPSLESLHNARSGRYQLLELPDRIGQRHAPIELLDIRGQAMDEGISAALRERIRAHLKRGQQVMLFLNRRGFAPAMLCHDCGWVADCPRCDAHMTLHQGSQRLRCHHCGTESRIPAQCPSCHSDDLRAVGHGTERLEQTLSALFPDAGIIRIDRDSTRRKGELDRLLEQARTGQGQILLGTQMLAKGHHFPDVTLVALIDTDQGLFSADFRASEKMTQLILQVAGRAGRAEQPGEVLIQTHHPDHMLLLALRCGDYTPVAESTLQEREQAQLPPFSHIALLRAESTDRQAALDMLEQAAELARDLLGTQIELLGPVPAPMEKRAGRYRAQLWLQSLRRNDLHTFLDRWLPRLEDLPTARKVRWSIDIDPVDSL
jgi:primosomal protein N' (replication factor Y)